MRFLIALVWLAGAGGGLAVANDVPLPRPRPPLWIEPQSFREAAGPDFNSADVTSAATDCDERLRTIAAIEPMPRLIGPDACGGSDMVQLNAVLLAGGRRIELKPAPVLRCTFAESLAGWLHDEAAPRADRLGAALRAVETYDDFECRGRNRVASAKLSEHGKGNAVDLRAFVLADGRAIGLTDATVA
ncbi:MAG TPA: extensin family protein, partial [Pseudolabrys sp.]